MTGSEHTQTYSVPAASMEPTLHCAKPGFGCVKRGDVLVFVSPPAALEGCGASGKFIKRVVGLPGEKLHERDGYL
jgi:signal peptidase I